MKPELASKERLKALWHSFCEAQGWKPGAMTIGMRMSFESGARAALEELKINECVDSNCKSTDCVFGDIEAGSLTLQLGKKDHGAPYTYCNVMEVRCGEVPCPLQKGAILVRAKEKA